MTQKILSALLLFVLLITGCASEEPRPEPLRLSYRELGPITLNLQNFTIIDRTATTPQKPPYVGHRFRPTLAEAVNRLAMDRIQAVGNTGGFATLIIKEASVMERPLATSGEWFTREQAGRYEGRIEVEVEARAPDGSYGIASATATHSVTYPEQANDLERYQAYTILLNKLMANLNTNLEASMRQHLAGYVR